MRAALIFSSLSVLCLSAPLRPLFQDTPETLPTPTRGEKAAVQALMNEMQGTWSLKSLDSPTLDKLRRQEVGYMVVSGIYFSFEMHMSWNTVDDRASRRTSLSGTHRFEINDRSRMTASSIIGSSVDNDGRVVWEQPGLLRKYDVTCSGDTMKLLRDDGTTFEFQRMADSKQARDIYGRPLKVKDPNAPFTPPSGKREDAPKRD
ncbi:MAG: hypothetical protein JNL28_09600 [Planctomycetes bacterium]|nr:hypothetical protein [Planctomycetota bacterium]